MARQTERIAEDSTGILAQQGSASRPKPASVDIPSRRWWPKEHGTYFQLLFPLLSVLLGGSPGLVAALFALAAISIFLSHEPLLVILGKRGARARTQHGDEAKSRLVFLIAMALLFGLGAFAFADRATQYSAILPFGAALMALVIILQGLERSMLGESVAAIALATLALPVGIASGLPPWIASATVAIWSLTAIIATSAVKATIAHSRAKTEHDRKRALFAKGATALGAASAIALGAGSLISDAQPLWLLAAVLPTSAAALLICALPLRAKHLRKIGWTLAGSGAITLALVVVAIRTTLLVLAVFPAFVGSM